MFHVLQNSSSANLHIFRESNVIQHFRVLTINVTPASEVCKSFMSVLLMTGNRSSRDEWHMALISSNVVTHLELLQTSHTHDVIHIRLHKKQSDETR